MGAFHLMSRADWKIVYADGKTVMKKKLSFNDKWGM